MAKAKLPTESQFQVLEALARPDHYVSMYRSMGGGYGRASVQKKGQHNDVRGTTIPAVYALEKLRWVAPDPGFDERQRWRDIPDYYITDAGREALKRAKAARKASGEDTAIRVQWGRSAANPVPFKRAVQPERERLEMAFHDVVSCLVVKTGGRRQPDDEPLFPGGDATTSVYVQPEHVHALRNLRRAILRALRANENAGHRSGSSLVISLAEGSVSMDDYNEAIEAKVRPNG